MSVTLRHLYKKDNNPYQLTLVAGKNGADNVVSWIYMMEDDYVLPYFHGSELIVTTGRRQTEDPNWLLEIVKSLSTRHVAGLIINVGKFVFEVPEAVIAYCDRKDFPLLLMPWEIPITEMTQGLCVAIMNNRQESLIHDQAVRDAILRHDNTDEYREILSTYYDLESDFIIITICFKYKSGTAQGENISLSSEAENMLETNLRRKKRHMGIPKTRIGVVTLEHLQLLIINRSEPSLMESVCDVILEACRDLQNTHDIYIGIGQPVTGIEEVYRSFQRAVTAMQMAIHRNQTIIDFNEMGFDRILFSVKDDELLTSYADEILGPLERADAQGHDYIRLLRAYIENDRSLDGTAKELFVHRNTVNYQLGKLRALAHSPLKTPKDLFPFQVALAIRDM